MVDKGKILSYLENSYSSTVEELLYEILNVFGYDENDGDYILGVIAEYFANIRK